MKHPLDKRLEIAATQTKPTYRAGAALGAPRGFQTLNFALVRAGGLRLCSSELYSPKTFQTLKSKIQNPKSKIF